MASRDQSRIMDSSPPHRSRRSPPALFEDAIHEILFRIPADDPASLVRASVVCTTWLRILSDPAFLRDYRIFHRTPPMLGYLHNKSYDSHCVSRFVPTAASCLLVPDRRNWYAMDSRHGRVLFYTHKEAHDFVVWDPITDSQWAIPTDPKLSEMILIAEDEQEEITWNAAVLCATDGCDHLACHDGPFRVAFTGSNEIEKISFAFVYSSETTEWSDMVSIEHKRAAQDADEEFFENRCAIQENGHSVVVGQKVYFPCKMFTRILEYDVGEQELSVIDLQRDQVCGQLMGEEDGALVFVGIGASGLYVSSMEAGPNGAVAWGQRRVIELDTSIPPRALSYKYWMVGKRNFGYGPSVVGFANGAGVIFLNTEAGLFTIEVCSGQTKKIYRKTFIQKVMPYMSFYTRDHDRIVMPLKSKRDDHPHQPVAIFHD